MAGVDQLAEAFPQDCFLLGTLRGAVLFVPHYFKTGAAKVWVGPGYPIHDKREWTARALEAKGARRVRERLWARPDTIEEF